MYQQAKPETKKEREKIMNKCIYILEKEYLQKEWQVER